MLKINRRLISGLLLWLCVVGFLPAHANNESLNPNELPSATDAADSLPSADEYSVAPADQSSVAPQNEFSLSAEEIVRRDQEKEAKAKKILVAQNAELPALYPTEQPLAEDTATAPVPAPAPAPAKSVTKVQKPAVKEKGLYFTADFFGSHSSLMQFKGYQDDLSASLYLQYRPFPLVPFLRFLTSQYYYTPQGATDSISDRRISAGGGFDLRFTDWLRFRAMTEQINDKVAATTRQQESYGLIYNQYLQMGWLESNGYAESFYIPKLSNEKLDTFASLTLFHTFYLNAAVNSSHSLFPFVAGRVRVNDDAIFGLSGSNATAGAGYKYYHTSGKDNNFAIVLTGHSLIYQSKDFDGDPTQVQAAIQWQTN